MNDHPKPATDADLKEHKPVMVGDRLFAWDEDQKRYVRFCSGCGRVFVNCQCGDD